MSYQHLNRFKAHASTALAPNERLLAWHFAYEIRTKTNYFSESLRRLAEELELDPRTIRRAMARLVDLGLFERIDRTGTYAPIYRLLVQCPESCELLSDHYTKQELETLETLGGTNTPTLTRNQTPPYIEIKREDDFSSVSTIEEGSAELGYLLKALEKIKTLDQAQLTLKGLIELNPRAVIKPALEMTKKLEDPKRKRAYLEKVVLNTPEALLTGLYEQQATLEGSARLARAPKQIAPKEDLEGLEPEATWERLQEFAAETKPGFKPSFLSKNYLTKKALKGELTDLEINLSSMLEETLTRKAFPFMKPEVANPEDGSIYLDLNSEGQLEVKGWLQGWLTNVDFLYTAEELRQVETLRSTLEAEKLSWLAANPDQEFSISNFSMLPSVRNAWELYPDPLSEDQKSERFLKHFTDTFRIIEEEFSETWRSEAHFGTWITGNYSLEDDFKEWLQYFPERELGSHAKHGKKAYHAYLKARREFPADTLRAEAQRYWNTLTDTGYAKHPENFLADLVSETTSEVAQVAF
jgi:DNA-binding MarR family transcriptional regulator